MVSFTPFQTNQRFIEHGTSTTWRGYNREKKICWNKTKRHHINIKISKSQLMNIYANRKSRWVNKTDEKNDRMCKSSDTRSIAQSQSVEVINILLAQKQFPWNARFVFSVCFFYETKKKKKELMWLSSGQCIYERCQAIWQLCRISRTKWATVLIKNHKLKSIDIWARRFGRLFCLFW